MNALSLVDKKEIKKNFIFHHTNDGNKNETFFCNCGTKINKEVHEITSFQINQKINDRIDVSYGELNIDDMFNDIQESTGIVCPKCNKSYDKQDVISKIYPTNEYFLESFKYKETETKVLLYKVRVKSYYNEETMETYSLKAIDSYIFLSKKSKKIKYVNNETGESFYFTLDKVLDTINVFFQRDKEQITDNLIDVHRFINRIANYVSDSKNFNLVDELLKDMIGKSGIDILKKNIIIFLGIITYSNLSTIALTKGLHFLYDMMENCKMPDPSVLSDNNATSPLDIFNFLVNLENKKAQIEIDEQNVNKQGYLFEGKDGKIHEILYNVKISEEKVKGKLDISSEGLNVREDLTTKKVSKFLFKKINKFKEYKGLIKYTKHISYEELISLVMNNDIELLFPLFKKIEFRNDVSMETLKQFIPLVKSYAKRIQAGGSRMQPDNLEGNRLFRLAGLDNVDVNKNNYKVDKSIIKDEDINYSIISTFDFTIYDDCLRMMHQLEWDPNKEFFKIKDVDELEDYHNQLVGHFNMLADKEKDSQFKNFVSKFTYLEEYDGDLKIKIISTPKNLLNEAKALENCASSYVNRIAKGTYLLFMLYDKSETDKEELPFMMGLSLNKHLGLEFDQVKTKYNKQGSNKFKTQVMKYLESKDISYRELADLRIN